MSTYTEYADKYVSEKITLAHLTARWRPLEFQNHSGNVQSKIMEHVVADVTIDGVAQEEVSDIVSVISGKFYFDVPLSTLYVYSADIDNAEVITTVKIFLSSAPIKLPHDLADGDDVYYEPRIKKTSGQTAKISEEYKGLSLIGSSKLSVDNTDGYFDSIYNKYVWDNKYVVIYSYNREIPPSEAKVVYRGYVSNKSYSNSSVTFSLKDYLRVLDRNTHNETFTSDQNVNSDIVGNFKRRIFGKVDGLKLQSLDQMGDRLSLTGTFVINENQGQGILWETGDPMNAGKWGLAGAGIFSAGVVFGGFDNGSSGTRTNNTEKYDGESFTTSGNLNTAVALHGGVGVSNAALSFGGTRVSTTPTNATEQFSGATWSAKNNLNNSRYGLAGAGVYNAALSFGGDSLSGYTEKFDGTNWSNANTMNTPRERLGGCNAQNTALASGGQVGFGYESIVAEQFNGTSWTSKASMNYKRTDCTSAGDGSNLMAGGRSGEDVSGINLDFCERWEPLINSWYIDGSLNTSRSLPTGFGSDATGSDISAIIVGGIGISLNLIGTSAVPIASEIVKEGNNPVLGTGTRFLTELTPDDILHIGDNEYRVDDIFSDTSLGLVEKSSSEINGDSLEASIETPFNEYNRTYHISDNALKESETIFVTGYTTTSFKVLSTDDLFSGDIIRANTSPVQEREILRVVNSENIVEINEAWGTTPTPAVTVISKPAVQNLYILRKKVPFETYTVTNNSVDGCFISLPETFEKDLVPDIAIHNKTEYSIADYEIKYYYSNSRRITVSNDQLEIKDVSPRDYVRLGEEGQWQEVLDVRENYLRVRDREINRAYRGPMFIRRTNILNDDTVVSADVYGETEDGTTSGEWIRTSSQLFKVLLTESGYGDLLDDNSFQIAEDSEYSKLSVLTPSTPSKDGETIKKLITRINESVNGVMTVTDELLLKYYIFDGALDFDNMTEIYEHDVIKWSETIASPNLYSAISTKYNFKDVDYLTESSTSSVYEFENEFVSKYVGIDNTKNAEHFIYDDIDVLSTTQRQAFLSTQSPSVFKISSDLRFNELEIGSIVVLKFLNIKISDSHSTDKICVVTSVSKKDDKIDLIVSDLGNLYSRRAVITPDNVDSYTTSSEDERVLYSYITDDNGTLDDDEDTFGGNLII